MEAIIFVANKSNWDRETYIYRSLSEAAPVGFGGILSNGGPFGRS